MFKIEVLHEFQSVRKKKCITQKNQRLTTIHGRLTKKKSLLDIWQALLCLTLEYVLKINFFVSTQGSTPGEHIFSSLLRR